jgi:chemotaxis protein MotB
LQAASRRRVLPGPSASSAIVQPVANACPKTGSGVASAVRVPGHSGLAAFRWVACAVVGPNRDRFRPCWSKRPLTGKRRKGMLIRRVALTSACAAILVSGCVSQQKYDQEVTQYNQAAAQSKAYQELNQKLQAEIKADQAQIRQLQDRLTVTLIDEIVYPEGGWELREKGRATIDKLIPTLLATKSKRIEVQGYTDNLPIGPELRGRFPTNWELSTARACGVVRYMQEKGVDPRVMEASGFSEYRPVAPNDTPQGRAKNRRIEIVLVPQ